MPASTMARTVVLTAIALAAFAANSILCRLALRSDAIDPGTFVCLRLVAGAVVLFPFALRTPRSAWPRWRSAVALLVYAVAFSFAYLTLSAGTGALLLFGAVQATMIGAGLMAGERPRLMEWCGLACAAGGLVWLVAPGVEAPPWAGAVSMLGAGVAWGAYSLFGRGTTLPAAATACNFARAAPIALLGEAVVFGTGAVHVTVGGALLAVASGALTSGLGYVAWYSALKGMSATRASIVQLAAPAVAAFAGVVLLDERATLRLAAAGALVLGGVGLAVATKRAALAK